MNKYKKKTGDEFIEFDLEDKDFLLVTSIDNLIEQLKVLGNKIGR